MTNILMECGHTATSKFNDGPVCVICFGIDTRSTKVAASRPVLEGRRAICGDHAIVPSSYDLAFFEYRGPESRLAKEKCKNCMYLKVAHLLEDKTIRHCNNFEEHGPWEYDGYYDGCHGWD